MSVAAAVRSCALLSWVQIGHFRFDSGACLTADGGGLHICASSSQQPFARPGRQPIGAYIHPLAENQPDATRPAPGCVSFLPRLAPATKNARHAVPSVRKPPKSTATCESAEAKQHPAQSSGTHQQTKPAPIKTYNKMIQSSQQEKSQATASCI